MIWLWCSLRQSSASLWPLEVLLNAITGITVHTPHPPWGSLFAAYLQQLDRGLAFSEWVDLRPGVLGVLGNAAERPYGIGGKKGVMGHMNLNSAPLSPTAAALAIGRIGRIGRLFGWL